MINFVRITTFLFAMATILLSMFYVNVDRELAMARQAYSEGDMDQAIRMARRANRACSDTDKKTAALYLQARAAAKMNWTQEAKTYLDRLLHLDPQNARARLYRGELEYQLGDHQAALQDLDRGLPLASEGLSSQSQAYFLTKRGLTRLALNQTEQAEADALAALELAAHLPEAHDLMSRVFETKGDIKNALEECEQAYQLSIEKNKLSFLTPEGEALSNRLVDLRVKHLRDK